MDTLTREGGMRRKKIENESFLLVGWAAKLNLSQSVFVCVNFKKVKSSDMCEKRRRLMLLLGREEHCWIIEFIKTAYPFQKLTNSITLWRRFYLDMLCIAWIILFLKGNNWVGSVFSSDLTEQEKVALVEYKYGKAATESPC